MAILQLIAEEEMSLCFDFLEEKIREESRKLIESIYADEVNQFFREDGFHFKLQSTTFDNISIFLKRESKFTFLFENSKK